MAVSKLVLDTESKLDYIINTKGVSESLISDYVQVPTHCYRNDKDVEYGKILSAKIKGIIEDYCMSKTHRSVWELEKYCREKHANLPLLNDYYSLLKLESPHLFDSYMLYLEKDRQISERFYLPKRKQFAKFGLVESMQDLEDDVLDLLSLSLPPGTGKCQPLESKVLTPNGWTTMRKIKKGDYVLTPKGKKAKVLQVFPQGKKKVYEITFNDGTTCECSDDHLWYVKNRNVNKYQLLQTKDMIGRATWKYRKTYSIDFVDNIDFPTQNLLVDPYKLGKWLSLRGDDPDEEYGGEIGVYGIHYTNRFVPKDYLIADKKQRLALLQGMMDTEGVPRKRDVQFATFSHQLSLDIQELVLSLGGYCEIDERKTPKGRIYYLLTIEMPDNRMLFRNNEKKIDACGNNENRKRRKIASIKYIGRKTCRCIYIKDKDHLYVTDNYITTHNTTLEKFFTSWVIGRHPEDYSLFFSHSAEITDMFYRGVLDITTNGIEYQWKDIFPRVKLQSTNAKAQTINFDKYKPFASLQCTSIGAKNAGKVRCNRYLFNDDLIGGIEEALNKNILDKLWRIYTTDARQRKLNQAVKEIHIATRWSVKDIIGRLKEMYANNPRARFIAVPDIDEETGESNFDYEYNGMSVDFFNDQALTMDEITYRCLYKNEPIEREGLLYHEEDLRRYLELPLREPDAIIGVCDTKAKGSDYFVLPVMYQYDNDYYMVDCICDNGSDFGLQYQRIANIIVDHNMQQVEFESNTGGDRVAYEVDKLMNELGGRCNITTKPTESNKETRIIVNSDWIKKHVLFKTPDQYTVRDDYGTFMKWLLSYSIVGKNEHDDVPDCLANFVLFVTKKTRTASVEVIENPFRRGGMYW